LKSTPRRPRGSSTCSGRHVKPGESSAVGRTSRREGLGPLRTQLPRSPSGSSTQTAKVCIGPKKAWGSCFATYSTLTTAVTV